MSTVDERVDTLEYLVEQFIVQTNMAITKLSKEMREFKDEMQEFKGEMKDFKDEMLVFKDEMGGFKDETKGFLDGLAKFKVDMENDRKDMNKQWAGLAKKMGTLDEDLIAPATRPAINKYFKCDYTSRTIRFSRRKDGNTYEVDVLVVGDDKVFMIEVKSTPKTGYVDEILEKATRFKDFFPEYQDKALIPIYASIVFPDEVINYATKKGLYVMAYREWEYVDILNFDEVSSRSIHNS